LTFNDVELDFLFVAQTAQIFVRIVLGNCSLMHEDILVGVRTIDEPVSVLHVEPFDFAFDAGSQKFLFRLFFGWMIAGVVLILLAFRHRLGFSPRN
jgi:hypothetical protein